jgi:hypothetical protein
MLKNSQSLFVAVAVSAVLAISSASWAAVIFESSGWRISVGDDVAGAVSVVQDEGDSGVLVLQLFKNFLQPVGQSGQMASIVLTFEQIAPDALTASKIVINDESIYNGTGVTWTDFHWILIESGFAGFNQAETYPTGQAGFSTNPFNTYEWSQSTGSQMLSISGGTLASGSSFIPGTVGDLVIDVNLAGDGDQAGGLFSLKEIPTIPEPMTLSLLAIGGLCMAVRRKS